MTDYTLDALTPVQRYGDIYAKRDDLYQAAGVYGGKVRTCWALSRRAKGLVTAGSRHSPQAEIVAHVAMYKGVPCRIHVPSGPSTPILVEAVVCGAELVVARPGHNSVIIKRAREDARARGWTLIPFGMECNTAVTMTAAQVRNIPSDAKRIVVPVGSGMTLAGVLQGLEMFGPDIPVLGVVVGASPMKRLATYAPPGWRFRTRLVYSHRQYSKPTDASGKWPWFKLDGHYEAKAVQYLEPGDVFWCVGCRLADREG